MHPATLYRLSGITTIAGGVLWALGNAIHPLQHNEAALSSPTWAAAHTIFSIGAALLAISLAGICAWQARRAGWLGVIAYGMFTLGLVGIPVSGYHEAAVVSTVGMAEAERVAAAAQAITLPSGLLFIFGQIVFAIALLWGRVFPRIPAVLLLVTGLIFIVVSNFTSALAGAFIIGSTVMGGVAFCWLGASLIAMTRSLAAQAPATIETPVTAKTFA